jgi:hypothetical protein
MIYPRLERVGCVGCRVGLALIYMYDLPCCLLADYTILHTLHTLHTLHAFFLLLVLSLLFLHFLEKNKKMQEKIEIMDYF